MRLEYSFLSITTHCQQTRFLSSQVLPSLPRPQEPEGRWTEYSGTSSLTGAKPPPCMRLWEQMLRGAVPSGGYWAVCCSPLRSPSLCCWALLPVRARERKWSKDTQEWRLSVEVKLVSFFFIYIYWFPRGREIDRNFHDENHTGNGTAGFYFYGSQSFSLFWIPFYKNLLVLFTYYVQRLKDEAIV